MSTKENKKTGQGAPSGILSGDVQSPSRCTQQHCAETGPMRKVQSSLSQRKQTTLEDHSFVDCSQATPISTPPVSTYPPCPVSPNRCERIRKRLFPSPSGVYMCTVACMHISMYLLGIFYNKKTGKCFIQCNTKVLCLALCISRKNMLECLNILALKYSVSTYIRTYLLIFIYHRQGCGEGREGEFTLQLNCSATACRSRQQFSATWPATSSWSKQHTNGRIH